MATFVPAEPFPPGEYLRDEIEARGWAQEDLSDVTGISPRQIANIVSGKSGITVDTAQAIAAALGQEAADWLQMQIMYELAMAAQEQREVERRAKIYDMVPVREITRRQFIHKVASIDALEADVCSFVCISNIDEKPSLRVAARKSSEYQFTSPAQLAWYYRVRQVAEAAPITGAYKDENWGPGVRNLLSLAANAEDARKVPAALAEMGIRLVLVEHLRRTKIDGAAMWLNDTSPVVGLSLRYDRMDNFWFTLLHELVHIKYRHESPVDEDLTGGESDAPEIEQVANEEAAAVLVPPERIESFIARCGPQFYESRVVQFARAVGVHPGIVIGQLQNRKNLNFWQHTRFREKIADHIKTQAITDGWGTAITLE